MDANFIGKMCSEALDSDAVNHPYLHAIKEGDFPNVNLALKDFAFQYGLYSAKFTSYVSAVIENFSDTKHKSILQSNLAEELGETSDVELPPEVEASIAGQPHAFLFKRFQLALGVNADYQRTISRCQAGLNWSNQFLQLCEKNEFVGIGAIGIGTELIVSSIYSQILAGLEEYTDLKLSQHVFFNLHSECDDEHAAQLISITEDLAHSEVACEQIQYGAHMAIKMRVAFWDEMLVRAQNFSASTSPNIENTTALGY